MSIRTAKFLGMLALMLGLALYCVLVVAIAVTFLPSSLPVEVLYYATAGIVWVVPARWLVLRINRDED